MKRTLLCIALLAAPALAANEWRRPFISDVFFYWYLFDRQTEWGWDQGVHFTPLYGYYDSRTFKDNRHSLWLASEWGMTHHFIDYWAPTWKGEDGEMREKTVFRAAESLRKDGYDIWMAYYQDGSNFAMDEFAKNVSEKRDVHQWLRDFGRSPVMPRVGRRGRPMQMVYARNGAPKITATDEGFRTWLRGRYKTVGALNKAWGTDLKGFNEAKLDFGSGRPRADSIRYQYHVWQAEWAKLDSLVQKGFKLPGVAASFDVAYKPFRGFGRADYFRVFGGPHSYAGIFGQPHEQDADRFLCSILAKKYDTVFFDHYKHCYHDWNIRVPGTAYLHEPHHFDRFWVGCLQRFNEGVLHMSWNEWWEGSNLEPSMETGKTYCEKHLFYSTIMQRCFKSIRDWGKDAKIGVILNDWHLLTNEGRDDDLFAAVQALRRLGAKFDILPEERVTAEALKRFKLVIAPGCDSGFGENAAGEDIHEVLLKWCRGGGDRKLWASANPRLAQQAGLVPVPAKAAAKAGKAFNLFIDVGVEGDERFLAGGASHRENWGNLPNGALPAGKSLTVRWTPAAGSATRFILPASPHRDHVLRLAGSALTDNRIDVLIDRTPAGTIAVKPGLGDYELRIPARLLGGRQQATLVLRYARQIIPKELDPKRFPGESRVCNLAIEYLQWSTANIAKGDRKTTYVAPKLAVRFSQPLFEVDGVSLGSVGLRGFRQPPLTAPGARALSTQLADGSGRDLLLGLGKGQLLYVNGKLSDFDSLLYWHALLANWAKLPPARPVWALENVMPARLDAGDTTLLLAYNEDMSRKAGRVRLRLPVRDVPLSEAQVLSRDGKTHLPLKTQVADSYVQADDHDVGYYDVSKDGKTQLLYSPQVACGYVEAEDHVGYYGVYQFAFSPVRVITPKLEVCQGESAAAKATVENLTDKPLRGTIRISCVVPTLTGPPTKVELKPREKKQIELTIQTTKLTDWGVKTVTLELDFNGRKALLFRPCLVLHRPDIRLQETIINAATGKVTIENKAGTHAINAPAEDIHVSLGSAQGSAKDLGSGEQAEVKLPLSVKPAARAELRPVTLAASYRVGRSAKRATRRLPATLAVCPETFDAPADAVRPLVVLNPAETWQDHRAVFPQVPEEIDRRHFVRTADGRPAAWALQTREGERPRMILAVVIPPRSARVFFLCMTERPTPPPSPLRIRATDLGTGKGKVVVSNLCLKVTLDEARGGTVTSLISKRTGREYAAESLGAAYGRFGQYDPRRPATNTVGFVRPGIQRQADSNARISLIEHRRLRAECESAWDDEHVLVPQCYSFTPWENGFLLFRSGAVRKPSKRDRLVLVDARFRGEPFTKSYPNFVGIVSDKAQAHFGWRIGTWAPDRLTFMHPPDFTEGLSLLRLRSENVTGIRQGFWPAQRPKAGKLAYAQAEYLCDTGGELALILLDVALHRGHHHHAGQRLQERGPMRTKALTVQKFTWGKRFKPIDVKFPKDWFSPYWPARAVVEGMKEKGTIVVALAGLAEKLGAKLKAVRCVQVNAEGEMAERDFELSGDRKRAFVEVDPRWGRTLHVYGCATEALPARGLRGIRAAGIEPETFERPAPGWQLGGRALAGVGREDTKGLRLQVGEDGAPVLISNRAVSVRLGGAHRLVLWARTQTQGAVLRANFYVDARYDFGQAQIDLTADGKWRRYEATVRAGKFPPTVRPIFRLWALGGPQTIDIDDLTLTPITPPPAAVKPGKIERLW